MPSRSAAKGAAFERLIVTYLRAELSAPHLTMPRAGARHDRGDIAGVRHWTFQAKAYADVARGLREGLADLAVEQANTGTLFGGVLLKRIGRTDPAEQVLAMRLGDAVPLIRLSSEVP